MLSAQRASTWPIGPERFYLNGERLVLALVPASMVERPQAYGGSSSATDSSWLGSWLGTTDPPHQFQLTQLPIITTVHPLEVMPRSIDVDASSRDLDHNPDLDFSNVATPEGSVLGRPRSGTPDILTNIGCFSGTPGSFSPRLTVSDGARTPVSQSGISLSSGYHYQSSSTGSATPTVTMPVFVAWQRPNLRDILTSQAKFFQQPSSKTFNRPQTSARIADAADASDPKVKIQHFENPAVQKIRAEARQGLRDLGRNKIQTTEHIETRKRNRSPSPEPESDLKGSEDPEPGPDSKRSKLNEDESKHSDAQPDSRDQESP